MNRANTYYNEVLQDKYYFLGADASRSDSTVSTERTKVDPSRITGMTSDGLTIVDNGMIIREDVQVAPEVASDVPDGNVDSGVSDYISDGSTSGGSFGGVSTQNTESEVALIDIVPFYKKPMVIGGAIAGVLVIGFLVKKYMIKK